MTGGQFRRRNMRVPTAAGQFWSSSERFCLAWWVFFFDGFRKLGRYVILVGFFLYVTALWVSARPWPTYSAALVTFFSMLLINSP